MSQPAARPWWADVQHLRPTGDGSAAARPRGRRHPTAELHLVGDEREAAARPSEGDGRGSADDEVHGGTPDRGRFGRDDLRGAAGDGGRFGRDDVRGAAGDGGRFGRDDLRGAAGDRPRSDRDDLRRGAADRGRFDRDDARRTRADRHPTGDLGRPRGDERRPTAELRLLAREERRPGHDAPRVRASAPASASASTAASPARARAAAPRRTVEIRGNLQPLAEQAERGGSAATAGAPARRRRARPQPDRLVAGRPDRIAMWAVLLGVLLILLAALSAGDARAATPTSLGDRTLEVGMVGRDVRHLQLRLKRLRLLDAPATARFGARTRAAVRRYQRSRCLKADGIAGAATIRALRTGRRACRRARGGSGGASSRPRRGRQPYRTVALGTRTLARGARGRDVRTLQRLLGLRSDGIFGNATKRAVRRFQRRAGLHADGAAGPATLGALAGRRMRARTATYYGPGLYGNRTACGQTMTRRLRGVAHKTLPCGTPVVLHHGGRFVTTRVVDRGPFVDGVAFDLTIATARQLGLSATARIRAAW